MQVYPESIGAVLLSSPVTWQTKVTCPAIYQPHAVVLGSFISSELQANYTQEMQPLITEKAPLVGLSLPKSCRESAGR